MKKNVLLLVLLLSACGSVSEGDKNYEKEEKFIEISDEQFKQLRALRYFKEDPICMIQGLIGIADDVDSDLINISPNPTSSNVNVKLLSGLMERFDKENFPNHKPIQVKLQLLFNERTIHQWSIENYWDEIFTISDEHLKESGTYLLVCNFMGSAGCTTSDSASFMVVKK